MSKLNQLTTRLELEIKEQQLLAKVAAARRDDTRITIHRELERMLRRVMYESN